MAPEVQQNASEMNAEQRRQAIIDWVLKDGSVSTDELVRTLAVSQMTIYRDLGLLEEQGWVRKVRGGASASPSVVFEHNVMFREREHRSEKEAIGRTALRLIEAGQAVFLDDSTTSLQLARMLGGRGPLTVITNSLAIINFLSDQQSVKLIALGGTYHRPYDAFIGVTTDEAARPLKADIAFVSTSAVTDGVCYHQSQDIIMVKRSMMRSSRCRVLLADSSKFARYALYELAPLTAFDLVVVDEGMNREELARLEEAGVKFSVAKVTSTADGDKALVGLIK